MVARIAKEMVVKNIMVDGMEVVVLEVVERKRISMI